MKIAVIGSINMDMTLKASHLPGKGETLRAEGLCYVPGGKGANQAVAAARLGAQVELFGCVGTDGNGAALLESLQREGIETAFIRRTEAAPTGLAVVTVGDQDNTILVVTGANDLVTPEYLDSIKSRLLLADLVVLQLEIPLETVEYAVDFCHSHGIRTILNPAPARPVPESLLQKVSYLTPNRQETAALFGEDIPWREALKRYPGKLVVTLGEEGAAACLPSGELLLFPARKTEVVDTTGAGDTLNGALAVQLAAGKDLREALRFANAAAGLSVRRLGAREGMPSMDEVRKELEKDMDFIKKQ